MTHLQAKEEILNELEKIKLQETNKYCGKQASIVRIPYETGFERAFKLALNMICSKIDAQIAKDSALDHIKEATVVEKTKPLEVIAKPANEAISASGNAIGSKGKKKK